MGRKPLGAETIIDKSFLILFFYYANTESLTYDAI